MNSTDIHRWFEKFRSDDFSLQNEPRGRPETSVKNNALKPLVETNPTVSSRELAGRMEVDHITILRHLSEIGKDLYDNRKRYARWLDRDEACAHTPRPLLHPRKILITVWWNVTALIHYSFLRTGMTITAEKYCQTQPYSPDLSPTDFHLFKHLELFLRAKEYENEDSPKNAISEFIDSKDQNFFKTGIHALKSRWEKCIEVNGAYFDK
ncbi:histone-lysine N-methyltransferase SETMAR-like [Vespa velutina]|uniref:histone-lysine N-methyltransferase SETMAR-like n=1 Tax=Vespa velutina TaxID=202808 RepID=UPI001FB52195|nr:histone-lysine N-methyltransferase SETMAR-like [Vespa velutina]